MYRHGGGPRVSRPCSAPAVAGPDGAPGRSETVISRRDPANVCKCLHCLLFSPRGAWLEAKLDLGCGEWAPRFARNPPADADVLQGHWRLLRILRFPRTLRHSVLVLPRDVPRHLDSRGPCQPPQCPCSSAMLGRLRQFKLSLKTRSSLPPSHILQSSGFLPAFCTPARRLSTMPFNTELTRRLGIQGTYPGSCRPRDPATDAH